MEIVAPAGSAEKLAVAYAFGADAAYVGVPGFSLRAHAEQAITAAGEIATIRNTYPERKLYAAVNAFLVDEDIQRLPPLLESLEPLKIDACIVSDIGTIEIVRRYLPGADLHLSTQANCTNAASARAYRDLGISRIVPARELTISQIGAIRAAVPEVELEVFVHGAMCMAYSGRCYLSSHLAERSANSGDCAHPCRWGFALAEEKRPGEFFPIEESDGLTTILSARDLMAIDLLANLRDAGVDAIKIEGRMKSALYVAVATRAYRLHVDALLCATVDADELQESRSDLLLLSNRGFTTGFLADDERVHEPSNGTGANRYRLMAIVTGQIAPNVYAIDTKNTLSTGAKVDFIRPGMSAIHAVPIAVENESGATVERAVHGGTFFIRTDAHLPDRTIVRAAWYTSER